VKNKHNSPVNIRFVAKTSDIRNFSENIRSDGKTSEVATLPTSHYRTWSEHLKIVAMLLLRNTVKQQNNQHASFATCLCRQAKQRTWVNCKLITAQHQDNEPGSCALWVSYRQTNCQCKN